MPSSTGLGTLAVCTLLIASVCLRASTPAPHLSAADSTSFSDIVEHFIGGLPAQIKELQDAVERNDPQDLKRLVHQLKGAAGGYGFSAITTAAAQLEKALQGSARVEEAHPQLSALLRLCGRAIPQPA